MHLSKSVYYTVQSYITAHALWQTLLSTYEKKETAMKIYLIRRLYNFWMKESDSVTAHLSAYEILIAQLSSQGMKIGEEFVTGDICHDNLQCLHHGNDLCICYRGYSFRKYQEKVT